jgi:hypothetical protein
MLLEVLAAVLVGVAALWLVLQPILAPGPSVPRPVEPLDPEETPRGIALAALKEIDFDRETGKLSQDDYEYLKSKYTRAALDTLRSGPSQPSHCEVCGIRPEPDAVFCSSCGRHLSLVPLNEAIPHPPTPRTASA